MAKIFMEQLPKGQEMIEVLTNIYPAIDPLSYHSYLLLRKISIDLDNSLESFFSKHEVSTGRFTLLMILFAFKRGVMPSELAQVCGVTQATVSGLLTGLEKAELISRVPHEQDGRAFVIHLAPKGEELIDKVTPDYFARVEQIFKNYSAEQRRMLIDLLEGISAEIKSISQPQS